MLMALGEYDLKNYDSNQEFEHGFISKYQYHLVKRPA